MISIRILDNPEQHRSNTERYLTGTGNCRIVVNGPADVTVVFDPAQGQSGLETIARLRAHDPDHPVVVVAARFEPGVASAILVQRAEYMVMTDAPDVWLPVLRQLLEKVTEPRHLKRQIELLNKKMNIVGSVTRHDVLNQLTAVNGYSELLEMIIEDPKQRSFIAKERAAVDKIRRQFQFAKDYQSLGTEPPCWQAISPAIHRAGEQVNLEKVTVHETCGDAAVYADPALEKVFASLFDNTLRHGTNVTEIRIYLREDTAMPAIIFEDNGAGIPVDDKDKIFEKGFGKLTGLGLFLARDILALTGMSIQETGEPGKCARFEIRVPPEYLRHGAGTPSVL